MINKSKRALEGILTKTTAFLGLTAAAMTTYEKLVLSTDKPFELYSPALLLGIGIPLAVAYKGTKHL
ncbi:MAG: hypothetical protein KC548_05015, partial [Nanoarchaeota archaeon]|nr:hypothetical protein [Nanoarchaeota archaeon]